MTANLIALIVATSILVSIPGPNVALIVANSLRYGLRMGIMTVAGTTAGMALQLAFVVAGMLAVVEHAAAALSWVRWIGVAYLVYLGIRTWREPPPDLVAVQAAPAMFWRGCMLAAINPKTLVFIAAFFPQFISAADMTDLRMWFIAGVFLAVIFVGDTLWAVFATSARTLLARYAAVRNRAAGAFLLLAGIGLALARR
jgi:threonine/homoserine/homoserine lactone efflux protein